MAVCFRNRGTEINTIDFHLEQKVHDHDFACKTYVSDTHYHIKD